ncbi:MAG: crossover junction endodeoxyribonuclease RuvC [Candidatus Taylorbacteria bacterium RIFCSPLOWO2_12_FULL_43_20]|uniref:Crossover junction endodeoxyribonuclease RuvC n=1 Tax=Candidatus Taylorbacteria bacterium RIFCSPLOWO2_12_FULL_43_20 TaxID=1802332 RepID=A0A1G2P0V1_9BACT|nr:MAG: crossover junction endodeoxyribonuclease RuvC [Candidatus Taylorbacteria bacterium RIFCSPHIGHO2_02_FULL_43_55]OHA29913.1 MAG: crossover junction endodeoxyribonuclease RuvC [Candidatus Taylorbacteria bacterium RIFCSPHIGHO2_12_FULL_42_34]OHA30546.1 MAG: crossover junction endodeoxyribonuclease RuvC [Candidatus Taylorbacteria bacterium RIFCSPLOWO2_01_FULL_43_83]OHA38377.1 MAG: crossover junction endodeoxyribonuclease RuvC [Candidatus Taylorbacteria bacterium RIFCSPLOWO2_02_FULL_43_22b]OHA4
MRIIAIDPGYEKVGIAVLEKRKNENVLLYSGCFKTPSKQEFHKRLVSIGEEVKRIIDVYNPEILAIETLFFNNNQKTAMRVSEARGVIVVSCAAAGLRVLEYTPLQVKIAVTSHGRSGKAQMTAMVKRLLVMEDKIAEDDEYDAISVGLTCLAHDSSYGRIE